MNIPNYRFSILCLSLPFLNPSDLIVQTFALVLRGSWHTNAGDCYDTISNDLGLGWKMSLHVILCTHPTSPGMVSFGTYKL